ncbi:MAG: hypothetical protein HY719_13940 [Planctomycetes bacterium]|nr:hypothetical protein [Planctomycetota bacterium]
MEPQRLSTGATDATGADYRDVAGVVRTLLVGDSILMSTVGYRPNRFLFQEVCRRVHVRLVERGRVARTAAAGSAPAATSRPESDAAARDALPDAGTGVCVGAPQPFRAAVEGGPAVAVAPRAQPTVERGSGLLVSDVVNAYHEVWRRDERDLLRSASPLRACAVECRGYTPVITFEGVDGRCALLDRDPECRCPNSRIDF